MHERLSTLTDLVAHNLSQAQEAQKTWYDKNARNRTFQTGDQVLVLLPTSTNKLLAEWQGPYTITRRIGKVNYEVPMPNRRKRHKIFYVNMLREWNSPTALSCWAEEIVDDDSDCDGIFTYSSLPNSVPQQSTTGAHPSVKQTADITSLLQTFTSVLNEKPGRTSVTEHRIITDQAQPVRLPPYRIPHAYRDTVR